MKSIQAKTRVVVQLLRQQKTFFIIVDFLIFDCKKVKTLKVKSSNQYEKLKAHKQKITPKII